MLTLKYTSFSSSSLHSHCWYVTFDKDSNEGVVATCNHLVKSAVLYNKTAHVPKSFTYNSLFLTWDSQKWNHIIFFSLSHVWHKQNSCEQNGTKILCQERKKYLFPPSLWFFHLNKSHIFARLFGTGFWGS